MLTKAFQLLQFIFVIVTFLGVCAQAKNHPANEQQKVARFIQNMVKHYHFDKEKLTQLLKKAKYNHEVIAKITHPYESKPWYFYHDFFITSNRIQSGVQFWKQHEKVLNTVHQQYGVPPNIIVAILGVETEYGEHAGKFYALNALYTLAFDYPPRAHFFRNELTQYLLLTRELSLDPLQLKSSYAGALGMPQFMPSSYRHYAVNFRKRGKIDLINNSNAAIASVANFLKKAGWQPHHLIAVPVAPTSHHPIHALPRHLKPYKTLHEFQKNGIQPKTKIGLSENEKAILFSLKNHDHDEYWLGLHNFYVLSHYNPRINYVMAIYQLSQALYNAKQHL